MIILGNFASSRNANLDFTTLIIRLEAAQLHNCCCSRNAHMRVGVVTLLLCYRLAYHCLPGTIKQLDNQFSLLASQSVRASDESQARGVSASGPMFNIIWPCHSYLTSIYQLGREPPIGSLCATTWLWLKQRRDCIIISKGKKWRYRTKVEL